MTEELNEHAAGVELVKGAPVSKAVSSEEPEVVSGPEAVSVELTGFEWVRVRVTHDFLDLEAGDVVNVPDQLAELWVFGRIAVKVTEDIATTAELSNKDFLRISSGLDVS